VRRYSKYPEGAVKGTNPERVRLSELRPGERIGGRYILEDRLGLGGMGEVWLADMEGAGAFRRHVVLKVLAPN